MSARWKLPGSYFLSNYTPDRIQFWCYRYIYLVTDILYNEEDDIDEIEARLLKPSKLEAWFTLNQNEPRARTYRYAEIPEYFTWDSKKAKRNIRVQKNKQFGCIDEVSPSEGQIEKFFLRVLLKRIRGATSFDNLLTLDDGQVCDTFRESCQRRNWLVEQGGEFERCLREAELHQHPRKFRKLFGMICCIAMDEDIAQIPQLWQTFKKSMMADFRHARMNHQEATFALLDHIKDIVSRCRPGVDLSDLGIEYDPLAIDDAQINSDEENDADLQENNFEENHIPPTEYLVSTLNKDQKIIFLRILNACARIHKFIILIQIYDDLGDDVTTDQIIDKTRENLFYIDGPGGTGKTYLYNTLITVLNDMAWTGIAANLLKGGTTVHRSFRLPLTLSEDTTCGWTMQSTQTKNIRDKVALIIWDEAPMTPRFAMEAANRYLIDIKRRIEPMGGKCVLFGGDFRQILPVVLVLLKA
ncbi:hypothetical protein JTB14_001613 [Gonioctena quinquepunctata]|nr:hypothetical protein JTB14_001613 [Gonioctena quinquepunctata]